MKGRNIARLQGKMGLQILKPTKYGRSAMRKYNKMVSLRDKLKIKFSRQAKDFKI